MNIKKRLLLFLLLGTLPLVGYNHTTQKPFSKVILWGHKLGSHTHSWIHWAFCRAFASLGYKVLWLNDKDATSQIDFSNSLFITEGQVDKKIPLNNTCRYILHNCYSDKYDDLKKNGNCINLQVYTHKCKKENVEKVDEFIYQDIENLFIYMPWATDMLPGEIEANKQLVRSQKEKNNKIIWVGTIGGGKFGNVEQLGPFKEAAQQDGHPFFSKFLNLSMQKNLEHVRSSYMAPSIVGEWQLKEGYIPCRAFKNASYGAMVITNSEAVYELFQKKIVYNQDTRQLYYDAKEKIAQMHINDLIDIMNFVQKKHTYFNRIDHLFAFMHRIKPLTPLHSSTNGEQL